MEVPDFVQRSVRHALEVGKHDTEYKVRQLNEKQVYLKVGQVEEPDILHGHEEDDDGRVKEESAFVVMGCECRQVHNESGPKLNTECPCWTNERPTSPPRLQHAGPKKLRKRLILDFIVG